jgi:hypothetical protein
MRITTCSHPDHNGVPSRHEEWCDEDHEDIVAEEHEEEDSRDTSIRQGDRLKEKCHKAHADRVLENPSPRFMTAHTSLYCL